MPKSVELIPATSGDFSTALVAAYAFQPAKTSIELEEPQINIAAQQYEVQSVSLLSKLTNTASMLSMHLMSGSKSNGFAERN